MSIESAIRRRHTSQLLTKNRGLKFCNLKKMYKSLARTLATFRLLARHLIRAPHALKTAYYRDTKRACTISNRDFSSTVEKCVVSE